MRRLILLSATVLASFSASAMAASVPSSGDLVIQAPKMLTEDQRLVKVGDLKLDSASGRAALMNRVNFAVASLCDSSRFSVTDPTGSLACAKEAWSSVQPQLAQVLPQH
jgi:UrcA family protein